jgi:hypothetical protein
MKTCFWRDAIEADVVSEKHGFTSVVATDLLPVELVGRAVLYLPREIHIIGAHGGDAPYHDGPQGRGYSASIDLLALSVARRNQAANQILDGNDSPKIVLSIDNSRQTESRTAQLLHDTIGRLIVRSRYNAPYIFPQWFVSVPFEKDVQHIDQPGRLAVERKHGQTIETGRGAKLKRFLY